MDLVERMARENAERGIVPVLNSQPRSFHRCENCEQDINPLAEASTGRYPEGSHLPVYRHFNCPDGVRVV